MNGGSVLFAEVDYDRHPKGILATLRAHPETRVTNVIGDITETWIDFAYREFSFSCHDPFGEYWLFADPATPEEVLEELTTLLHGRLLQRATGDEIHGQKN